MKMCIVIHSTDMDSLTYPSDKWSSIHVLRGVMNLDDPTSPYRPVASFFDTTDLEEVFIKSQNLDDRGWLADLPPNQVADSRKEDRQARSTSVGDAIMVLSSDVPPDIPDTVREALELFADVGPRRAYGRVYAVCGVGFEDLGLAIIKVD